jgi:flagellin-like hook-associated protein FlgL
MVNYIYNGIELAALPSVNTATYPYALVLDITVLKSSDFNYDYAVIFCSDKFTYGTGLLNGAVVETIIYPSSAKTVAYACRTDSTSWTRISLTTDSGSADKASVPFGSIYVWTSEDIINTDTGEVQYKATELGRHVFAAKPTYSSNYDSSIEYKYTQGDIAGALRISAYRADTGILTYQWYLVGETSDILIDGATSHLFTPNTNEVGTYQYYCIVTNTYEEYTAQTETNIATIIITALNKALKNIDQQSASLGWIIGKVL